MKKHPSEPPLYGILFAMEEKKHGFRFTVIWYFSTIFLVFTAVMYIAFFALFTTTGQMQEKIDRYILLDRLADEVYSAREDFTACFSMLPSGAATGGDALALVSGHLDNAMDVLSMLEETNEGEGDVIRLHEDIRRRLEMIGTHARAVPSGDYGSYYSLMAEFDELLGSGISDYLSMVVRYDTVESIDTAIYLERMRVSIIYMIAICFAILILFSITFSGNLAKPVKEITRSARALAEGDYDTPELAGAEQLELASLEESINTMKKAIKERSLLEKELYGRKVKEAEMEKELNRAQYLALQAQINPHFLFNALNTVSHTALFENAEKTVALTNTLASFFRYTLEFRNEVSIREELDFCLQYLIIQKKRFSDRLEYGISCQDGLGGLSIPPLVVQPFVENAVIHGLEPKENGGRVDVSVSSEDDGVLISVVDDGIGFVPAASGGGKGGRIGIRNVEERLRLFFDNRSSVKICMVEEGGTRVEIRFPKRACGKDEDIGC